MSGMMDEISQEKYKVVQQSTAFGRQVIDEFNSPQAAFDMASRHNRAIGIGEVFIAPYLVYDAADRLRFGPVDLCPELVA